MSLSAEDLQRFAADGYLLLRGAIGQPRIAALRGLIAESLAGDQRLGALPAAMDSSFCPELRERPELTGLFTSLAAIPEQLFGEGPLLPSRTQVALRFPEQRAEAPEPGFHLDGFPYGANAIERQQIRRPTLVLGVFLTGAASAQRGNLAVWPGSHHTLARSCRGLDLSGLLAREGGEGLRARIEAVPLGPGRQLLVEPGDVVVLHHLTAHGAAANLSFQVREAIYGRVMHPRHDPGDVAPLTDATRFFAGVPWASSPPASDEAR